MVSTSASKTALDNRAVAESKRWAYVVALVGWSTAAVHVGGMRWHERCKDEGHAGVREPDKGGGAHLHAWASIRHKRPSFGARRSGGGGKNLAWVDAPETAKKRRIEKRSVSKTSPFLSLIDAFGSWDSCIREFQIPNGRLSLNGHLGDPNPVATDGWALSGLNGCCPKVAFC
ncbi:hypothetical protein ACLOJK_021694 [Asimina triloba]